MGERGRKASAPLPLTGPRAGGAPLAPPHPFAAARVAEVGLGGRIRLKYRPPLTRVCAAAAASRQIKNTALHWAATRRHAPCVESLLKAGADASIEDKVRDGAES